MNRTPSEAIACEVRIPFQSRLVLSLRDINVQIPKPIMQVSRISIRTLLCKVTSFCQADVYQIQLFFIHIDIKLNMWGI